MSPQSGSPGSLVKPAAPKEVKEADTAVPGDKEKYEGGDESKKEHKPDESKDKTSWIELELVYESNGKPVPGMAYEVTLADGETIASGSTDEKGFARIEKIDPGSCQISFPDLDKDAWEDA